MNKALLLPLLLAFAGCSNSNDSNALRPKIAPKPMTCEEFQNSLPPDIVKASLSVPEHPGSSHFVKVFYYYRQPLKAKVALFLNGGPGGASYGSYQVMEKALKEFSLEDKISFVYMDQRGNGCSSDYPQSTDDAELFERSKDYGTRGIVEDAEAIRRALGLSQWSIYGQSYGAMIAHRYAILYPNSLERVIAYANAITPDRHQRLADRLASQLDIWKVYFANYPDDSAKMDTLISGLNLDFCVKVDQDEDCGVYLIDTLVSGYLGWRDEWPKLHQWFEKLVVNGVIDRETVRELANLDVSPYKPWRSRALSGINYFDRDIDFMSADSCEFARKLIGLDELFDRSLNECSGAIQQNWSTKAYERADAFFKGGKDAATLTDFAAVLKTKPKNWFRLYSGTLDPWVPARTFKVELSLVGDLLTYRNFEDVGHDGFYSKREVLDDLLN